MGSSRYRPRRRRRRPWRMPSGRRTRTRDAFQLASYHADATRPTTGHRHSVSLHVPSSPFSSLHVPLLPLHFPAPSFPHVALSASFGMMLAMLDAAHLRRPACCPEQTNSTGKLLQGGSPLPKRPQSGPNPKADREDLPPHHSIIHRKNSNPKGARKKFPEGAAVCFAFPLEAAGGDSWLSL